jgi:hypothetical protein
MTDGSTYQCGVASVGVLPYFQYDVPAGNATGYVIVIVIVLPGVHPAVVKSNNPSGNTTPEGALPAGGLAGSPVSGMNCEIV